MRASTITVLSALLIPCAVACSDGEGGDDVVEGEGLEVSGTVRDFRTGDPLEGSVSVSTQGLSPAPTATVTGADYVLEGVISDSIFYVRAGAAPTHRATFGAAIEVEDNNLSSIDVAVISEEDLAAYAAAFTVVPTAATGVLLVQALDDAGQPAEGINGNDILPPAGADGPYFLDADLDPDAAATATSASGWIVFFEVDPGLVGLTADAASGLALDMPLSPVAPATATVATMHVVDGGVDLPTNVSFLSDVRPIFQNRGCENCHSGSGPGRDLGGLTLDGSVNLIHRELTEESTVTSTTALRIDLESPEDSLVLTMPSAEDPADPHPNITFTGPLDPDYLKILVWIREGALEN